MYNACLHGQCTGEFGLSAAQERRLYNKDRLYKGYWDAVTDVADFATDLQTIEEIAGEQLQLHSSSHNNLGDALRHSDWMRISTQKDKCEHCMDSRNWT